MKDRTAGVEAGPPPPSGGRSGDKRRPGGDRRVAGARPQIHGVLVVAKEPGPTSHDIVALVRRLTGVRRVGHGGTLDPFAAGVLPVLVGQATRLAEYHLGDEKEYRAVICFGARSTTDDLDGELTASDAPAPTRAAVEQALSFFRGSLEQIPPDYSAVRIAGRRAYELARHGKKPELRPRSVTVHALDLVEWDDADQARPVATLEMRVSAGTYVRALARDLGERLGAGAYLGALTRTASGPFRLADAHRLDVVRAALAGGRAAELLLPPDAGLDTYPQVRLTADEVNTLSRGQVVRLRRDAREAAPPGDADELVRAIDEGGRLVAIARRREGRLHPEKVFSRAGG
ncbi:MAG TPA: tRNA pseudouridine(55) synthase TruB [Candidatus Caenarcaniphilales bacterium]|nr:tRNA pseudouridine(55) synthase TruB [Candidatus Caenarcaniphilales bacterium]